MDRAKRHILVLLVIAFFVNYLDRSNLSIAAQDIKQELGISPAQLGTLLSSFFWTYAVLQLLAGWLVSRYDVRWIFALGFVGWSLTTACVGVADGFASLLLFRLLLGASESVAYPVTGQIITATFPEHQRGLANALVEVGAKSGPALGTLLGGMLLARYGWRALFVVSGLVGLLWIPAWILWGPRRLATAEGPAAPAVSVWELVRRRDALCTFLGMFCAGYSWYFMLTWLPSYLIMERHFSREQMAVAGSASFWVMTLVSLLGGWASDRLIARGASPRRVRQRCILGGLLCSMALIMPAVMVRDARLAVALLLVCNLAFGLFACSVWALTQTLAGPRAVGKWTGIQNFFSNLGGAASPWIAGRIVEATGVFFLAFLTVAIALSIAALCWALIGSKERL